jgi:hypothetical protein
MKLVRLCLVGKMQPIGLPSRHEPVGRGNKSLVFSKWLFAFIPCYRLKGPYSIVMPMAPDDLSAGSTDSGANNYFRRCGA